MNSLYKFFVLSIFAMVATVSCTEAEEVVDDPEIESSSLTFRFSVTTESFSSSRSSFDGLDVTWGIADQIYVVGVGDDGEFISSSIYSIDPKTISTDGKTAEFYGLDLTAGNAYRAYKSMPSCGVAGSSTYGFTRKFIGSYDYSSYDISDMNSIMQSDIFEYNGESQLELSLVQVSSLLTLEIDLDDESDYSGEIKSVEITTLPVEQLFLTSVVLDSYGELVFTFNIDGSGEQYGSESLITLDFTENVALNSSATTAIQIPVTWNEYIADPSCELIIKIETADDKEISIIYPLEELSYGGDNTITFDQVEPQSGTEIDRAVLIDLYNSTDGDNWFNNDNWCSSAPLSEWYGISVNSEGRVYELALGENNLAGTIPELISDLAGLMYLDLRSDQLSGSIPESIGYLTNLEILGLSSSQLSGSIPESIGKLTNLTYLCLYGNNLSGSIPESIGNLVRVNNIQLDDNQLSGSIPESIGNLTSLESFTVAYNELSGSIPESIGNLVNLTYINCYSNNLSGSIPESIGNLTNLTRLSLEYNELSGPLPESIGNMSSLEELYLYENMLSGPIPESIGSAKYLTGINLRSNKLSGSIPESIGNLTCLLTLNLNTNELSGTIPESIGNMTSLISIYLYSNQLSGVVPESIGNLANLQALNLSSNELTGSIPESIGDLSSLTYLYLYDNQLSGSIPESIGDLASLISLRLQNNQLTGSIPESIGDLVNLQSLYLYNNQLSGTIPESIYSLPNLTSISLWGNNFTE